jgi:transcriptional regulator with XRE-family HTH domain
MTITAPTVGVGGLLRDWRQRRRLSQLELSVEAEVSTRHLSFVETGRSKPSRELVLHLAEHLDVPLRERNSLLVAAGYAPVYRERRLDDDAMAPVRDALDTILAGHLPYPALIVDAHWNMVAANDALRALLVDVAPHLVEPPVNAFRVSLHPDGMAPRIENLAEWSAHLLERLRRQIAASADPALVELRAELMAYAGVAEQQSDGEDMAAMLFVPLRLRPPVSGGEPLAFFSTVATFGTALDITLAELSIESFFPADERTAAALRASC